MYVLSLAGFFRFDDISRIRSDISFKEGFLVVKVVIISQLSGSACLDELLKRYLAMFRIPPDSKDIIFKPISRKGLLKACCP